MAKISVLKLRFNTQVWQQSAESESRLLNSFLPLQRVGLREYDIFTMFDNYLPKSVSRCHSHSGEEKTKKLTFGESIESHRY
ncbi:hypothetical protein NIES2098_60370 [Calothrix sp. NIES-2098]|nr:hypothetical protein NIES2098_60370 [Calothrix sp. NIES-2098]